MYLNYQQPPTHTSFPDNSAFNLGEDTATWQATNFNAASEEILGLLGFTPSFRLQPTAPQWTNLLNLLGLGIGQRRYRFWRKITIPAAENLA